MKFPRYYFLVMTGVVFLMIGCSQPAKQFEELAPEQTGINFRNDVVENQYNNILTYEYTYNGAGVAAGDVNNDGMTDLYFSGNSVSNKLFINKGDWKFEDITAPSATAGRKDWKTGVAMADVNGDGWLDIYVCYSGNAPGEGYNLPVIKDHPSRTNQLFINNQCARGGTPTFTDRAKEYGLDAPGTFSTQSYFFDYDRDGDLDMFLVNHANMFYAAFLNTKKLRNLRHPYFGNKLYRNDAMKFTEVSAAAGIHGSGLNFGLSASISDLNLDGWPDLYVTNDYEEQDFCYINNRDGTFREVSHTVFSHLSKFGMGSDIADINNDGLQEVLVLDMLPEDNHRQKLLKGPDEYERYTLAADSGYHHQYMRNTLQLNRGFAADSLPRFSEVGQLAGVSNTDWSWSPFFVDLDNDGLKDIFISNGYPRDFTNLDFMKYTSTVYKESQVANKPVDYLAIIQQLPETRLNNYVFKNEDGLRFTNSTAAWGLTKKSVSNGAIYADLDNDGDYDLITNDMNDNATVLKNHSSEIQKNNFVRLNLKGRSPNTMGIGAKIYITTDSLDLFYEVYMARGYASSIEPGITVGLGRSSRIKEIRVVWPDGLQSFVNDAPINQATVIDQQQATAAEARSPSIPKLTIWENDLAKTGVDFIHQENSFVDFKFQRLLFYQLSRLGGKLSVADVNKDGNEDIFFEAPSGRPGRLFLGNSDGTFKPGPSQPWQADAIVEDVGSTFFDADSDGDNDLYVVSGGSEFIVGAPMYQDRLYINDGNGTFHKAETAVPKESTSGGAVAAADYDKDGDIDLFVGGRQSPGSYGILPRSFVLQNQTANGTVTFTDVTSVVSGELVNVGMVTDARWTDFDNDSWPDLIVVGEWMPVRVFHNEKGKLVERTDFKQLVQSNGWWTCIYPADIDSDGDMDYFLGNAGANLQFKASLQQPVEMDAYDFNDDGAIDPLVSYYIQGVSSPLASRDELLDQVGSLRKKFIKYADYADVNVEGIVGAPLKEKAYHFAAYNLQSCWLENIEGKELVMRTLPAMAQLSTVNGFLFDDFDGDGVNELLVTGNFFPYKPQLGRSDASSGSLFNYVKGKWSLRTGTLSEIRIGGDVRDVAVVGFANGSKRIVVSRNNDRPGIYSFDQKAQGK